MHYRLLNSAMMPAFGKYEYHELSPDEFAGHVRGGHRDGILTSYIGYQQTADFIGRLAGVPIAVSRDQTVMEDGDVLLIARLRYRVAGRKAKSDLMPEDFVFGIAYYSIS